MNIIGILPYQVRVDELLGVVDLRTHGSRHQLDLLQVATVTLQQKLDLKNMQVIIRL